MQTQTAAKAQPEINAALCLMTDAIEGPGISYWAEVRNVKRDEQRDVVSFEVRENEHEREGKETPWHSIDETKLRSAAKEILAGRADVNRQIAAQFIGNDWEYDAEGADCLIQMAAFGKVVYG